MNNILWIKHSNRLRSRISSFCCLSKWRTVTTWSILYSGL